MGWLEHLRARLLAAGLHVLLPDQLTEPADAAPLDAHGRPAVGGGQRGLARYFEHHPAGYVQLQDPTGLLAGDALDLSLLTIECVAPDAAKAEALATTVKATIRNRPVRPTPYTYATDRTTREAGCVRILLSFETRTPGV